MIMNVKSALSDMMQSFGLTNTTQASGATADATKNHSIYKAVIPKFLYKPPYGYPRFVDIPELRRLAATPYIEMCISTIIDEIAAIEWEIVAREGMEASDAEVKKVKDFFEDPNINKESWEQITRKIVRDILEIDSGVLVKVYDQGGTFKEVYARDGGTFTKNPDIFGTFANRAEYVPAFATRETFNSEEDYEKYLREKPAYFQYGWITGARPMPFGSKEIVYMTKTARTDSIYGRSPIEILMDVIQMLLYGVDHNLEYFTDNNVPKGVLQMVGATTEDIKRFREGWQSNLKKKDEVGNWRKQWHKMPIVGTDGKFERIQFSNIEMELLGQQEWFTKIVWACFGVTPSELGFTESSNRATEIIQSKVFRRKAIRPLLNMLSFHINNEIVWTEFSENVEFRYNTYDIEEDMNRHKLFEIQLKNGIRTTNEVRDEIGLDPVEGGDEIRTQSSFNPFDRNQMEEMSKKSEGKSMSGKKKALSTDSPLILRENEQPYKPKRIEQSILYLMRQQKREILKLLDSFNTESKLEGIKALDKSVIDKIKNIVKFASAGEVIKRVVRNSFIRGLDKAEKKLDMNFQPDMRTIDALESHTFDNVKDMSEEIANDIRQTLERGLLEGEGTPKLKKRVRKVFDVSEARAEAIARTETNRASNKGALEGYKQSGLKGKKTWVSSLDSRTSAVCRRLHGKSVALTEKFKDSASGWEGPHPPSHVNCRSRIVFDVEDN